MGSYILSQIMISTYALICCLISEFVTRYFVTTNNQYISYQDSIQKIEEKMAKLSGYENKRKREKLEKEKSECQQKIAFIKFKPMLINAVILIFSSIFVNFLFTPVKVATLPFEPFKLFVRVTHRNLPGDNMRDCSIFFFYVLVRMTLRPIIAKLMGNSNLNESSFLNAFAPNNENFKSE